jgi:hypothetical protein
VRRAAAAALAAVLVIVFVTAAGCSSSPTVRGFAGEKGTLSLCEGAAACSVPPTPPNRGMSAGCGKTPTEAPGQYARLPLAVSCEADNARDRLYYVRLPPNYDPNRPYRTVYLGPGCGPPQDSLTFSKVYPIETASDPDAILVAMEQGFYNKAEYSSANCSDDPNSATYDQLCHYCFDDGAASTCADSVEYGYFDLLHRRIEADYCVDTDRQFYAGYSSGGWMAHELGCQFPDVLRAQASVTGGLPPVIRDGTKTCVDHPIAAFLIHDAMDPSNPYSGSVAAVQRLLALNHCAGGTVMPPTTPYTITAYPNNTDFNCYQYTGCPAEYPIVFCTSRGKSHDSQASAAVPGFWEFFKRF